MKEDSTSLHVSGVSFSLQNLLMLIAFIAVVLAIGIANQLNASLVNRRELLKQMTSDSGRLKITDPNEMAAAEQVKLVPNIHTWLVHIPERQEYKICFGVGDVFSESVPLPFDSVPIPSGQRRVTLVRRDSAREGFRYTVYVDGVQVMEKSMGSQWMPNDWYSTNDLVWPRGHSLTPNPLNLLSQTYNPQSEFEPRYGTSDQIENFVTCKGFRLWVDLKERSYTTKSPFIGFITDESYHGIGLRDGLRYLERNLSHKWAFTLPASGAWDPILHVEPVFYNVDGQGLSAKSLSILEWQLSSNAECQIPIESTRDRAGKSLSVFLHAKSEKEETALPVIELRWEVSRPDEIGLRIADTPTNTNIESWGLQVRDGTEHLWRELKIADNTLTTGAVIQSNNGLSDNEDIPIPIKSANERLLLQWQTNETMPIVNLRWINKQYNGLKLYQGQPQVFSLDIPRTWAPKLSVRILNESPKKPGDPFPGGPIYSEIQLAFPAAERDWLWLKVKPKQRK